MNYPTISIIIESYYIPTSEEPTYTPTFSLNTLKKVILTKTLECHICLDKLLPGSCVKELPCQHMFCVNCIDTWLQSYNSTCPVCKYSLINGSASG
jgi:E3 ubiquitin-protein ligase RNF115/126